MTSRDEYMTEMWEALGKYQPYADKRGFGAEWLKMTVERTADAARAACMEAYAASGWDRSDSFAAASAAWLSTNAAVYAGATWWAAREAVSAGEAAWYAADAIKHINKAIEMEENK